MSTQLSNPVFKVIYGYGTPQEFAQLLDEVLAHFAITQERLPTKGFSDIYCFMRDLREAVKQLPEEEPKPTGNDIENYKRGTKEELITLMLAKDALIEAFKVLIQKYEQRERH